MESERFLLNKIRQHLKENYNLITEFKLGTGSNRLIPDAVIYRNEEPVALVEIKKNLNIQTYNFALKQFEFYQKEWKVPFGIIFDGKQALLVKLPCNDTHMSNSSSLEEVFEKLYNYYEIDNPLSENDIDVRTGLHCAPRAHEFFKTAPNGTVRFSLSYFTNDKDFEKLEEILSYIEENS